MSRHYDGVLINRADGVHANWPVLPNQSVKRVIARAVGHFYGKDLHGDYSDVHITRVWQIEGDEGIAFEATLRLLSSDTLRREIGHAYHNSYFYTEPSNPDIIRLRQGILVYLDYPATGAPT